MTDSPPLVIVRCGHCQGRFLPHPGLCPRCGSGELTRTEIPPEAAVLAATELLAPSAGWASPHRLAIVEGAESVRILAIVRGQLPAVGAVVTVRLVAELYEVLASPAHTPA
ncbi:MAG: hypothetical protein L3K05_08165 [Thermoplasmata archaeon]|nr:hypothetical protein [Thermoplasmata archaeon]